jgi:two-component system, LytTR family, sensor kinase
MNISDRKMASVMNNSFTEASDATSEHWFIRFKIYHLLFWFIYHYAWTVVNVGNPMHVLGFIMSHPKFLFYVIFQAFAVYFNLYFLIPCYLAKGRYAIYLLYLGLTTITASALIATGYYLGAYLKSTTVLALYGNGNFSHYFITYTLPSTLTSMFLAMSIKLTKNWIQSRKREQLLEKERLENELKFLRSQMNPHFLFNTINSIFVLIHKNPDLASEALAKFSGLLRYQLYDCNEDEIPLSQELHYLENYIELEKLRLESSTTHVHVAIDPPPIYDLTIAPLLLIPFVENAFKHVSTGRNRANYIRIRISFENNRMEFVVSNTVSREQKSREAVGSGGIGLQNVRRRLSLIYGHQRQLDIKEDEGSFTVALIINLRQQEVPEMLVEAN